jgi:hypothetical protein
MSDRAGAILSSVPQQPEREDSLAFRRKGSPFSTKESAK